MTTSQTRESTSQQLSLLQVSELPVQFRLDQRTRQRGLAHIAEIRRQLAAKSVHPTTNQHAHTDDRAA